MLRKKIRAEYHQIYLAPPGPGPEIDPHGPDRGLLEVTNERTCLVIYTGIAQGPVWMTLTAIEQSPETPLADAIGDWEVAQEVDLVVSAELIFDAPTYFNPIPETAVIPSRPGLHRVRVLARGRSGHYDHVVRKATEEYELTIWPTEGAEDPEVCGNPVPY